MGYICSEVLDHWSLPKPHSLVGGFSPREQTPLARFLFGTRNELSIRWWLAPKSVWANAATLTLRTPVSKNVPEPNLPALRDPLPTPLRDTHRGSSGSVTWSFSHVMTGAGRPSIWHWKRAVPFSSTVCDSGCREKPARAGGEDSEKHRDRRGTRESRPRRARTVKCAHAHGHRGPRATETRAEKIQPDGDRQSED